MGVNKALRDQAADILIAANSIDGSNFERVEKQLAMASKAVMALPAIPVLIYVAPIAGGLIGLSTLVTQATIAIPVSMLIMATGKSAVDATMDTKYLGGGWFCNFANESIDQVPEALYKATRVMWIPSAAALLASTPIGLGTLVGEPGVTIVAAKAGPLVYRAINLTVAYAFTARAVYAGFEARSKCVAALDQIKNADFSKETPEVIDAELTNAEKTCLSASIDLGFALWGTKRTFSDSSKLSKMAIRKNVTK